MKISTIVPTTCTDLIEEEDYFLVLTPLLKKKSAIEFYKRKSREGAFITLDSPIVESGAEPPEVLLELALKIEADEICLPDVMFDCDKSLDLNYKTLCYLKDNGWEREIMAIPQGNNEMEYLRCIKVMLNWIEIYEITAIGISGLQISENFPWNCRGDILNQLILEGYDLPNYNVEWHLLGSVDNINEIANTELISSIPIRGVDSRIAYLATKAGLKLVNGMLKPNREFDFYDKEINKCSLKENIEIWKKEATKGINL